ncbi:heavy metal translocating P-type ATPase [Pedobacter flavus]|uniref:P-type Zn(2+) transporter n=1 Tax=Pedobacter flavus TaxID=3113906 RepID=A0ABU7GYL1_9SPHI|nr:heavy metal translocating P-type ATPase [Pedobacter sp. VNH31]MEE1884109.1 heavy metal translocating P-type ATPase [Pedobacter sp. VNH31]
MSNSKNDHHDHNHNHSKNLIKPNSFLEHWDLLLALAILIIEMVVEYSIGYILPYPFNLLINIVAYLLAGRDVLKLAFIKAKRLDIFNEFFLMSVATLGAFSIGSYTEGVAVMVFYSIGEWFQDAAVNKAKRSIKSLLDIRPDVVTVKIDGQLKDVKPESVNVNDVIEVKPGEKVALDGVLLAERAVFNTAALTGESKPDQKYKGEVVLAGMVNLNSLIEVRVSRPYKDSKLSKILSLVQDATARKSKTQLFISKFAKVYTPIVFLLAILVVFLPYLWVDNYEFNDWFYRALVFLVISCPCALVVSIPLGYFGGIGLASKNGILFKGSNYLDIMTAVDTVVMDKTGTLTKGVFKVQKVEALNGFSENDLIKYAVAIESKSTHPIAKAIEQFGDLEIMNDLITEVEEIPGYGLVGLVDGKKVVAGNKKLLEKFKININAEIDVVETLVLIGIDNILAGYFIIADEIKEDAKQAVSDLHSLGIKTVMLSGDKQSVVEKVGELLGIGVAIGNLLPEDKVNKVSELKSSAKKLAFVGDGVNDAPVVAMADAGIAMGGLGSDATIETADIVIQNDQPSKIVDAIKIGKITRFIVWENIVLAMTVKIAVLVLGAGGIASLWEAVIADVGVALLAILNAVRIQRKQI